MVDLFKSGFIFGASIEYATNTQNESAQQFRCSSPTKPGSVDNLPSRAVVWFGRLEFREARPGVTAWAGVSFSPSLSLANPVDPCNSERDAPVGHRRWVLRFAIQPVGADGAPPTTSRPALAGPNHNRGRRKAGDAQRVVWKSSTGLQTRAKGHGLDWLACGIVARQKPPTRTAVDNARDATPWMLPPYRRSKSVRKPIRGTYTESALVLARDANEHFASEQTLTNSRPSRRQGNHKFPGAVTGLDYATRRTNQRKL